MPALSRYRLNGKNRDSYLRLIQQFPLISIKSADHFAAALEVMDTLFGQGNLDPGEEAYLDALSDLIATYEDVHHVVPPASDGEMLRHLIEAKGITQVQLSRETGLPKSTISEVLSGKKPFSRQMMRKLAEYFQVPISVLAANI